MLEHRLRLANDAGDGTTNGCVKCPCFRNIQTVDLVRGPKGSNEAKMREYAFDVTACLLYTSDAADE